MKIKLECAHADTCLPDYWCGHHLPHVQIAAWSGMSMAQIKRAIISELSEGAVMGSGLDSSLLSADWVTPENEARAVALTKAAHAAVNRMRPARKGQRAFFRDIEAPDDDDDGADTVYAFFVFVECE